MQGTNSTNYKNTILYYTVYVDRYTDNNEKKVIITGGARIGSLLEIPALIDDMKVVGIDKKAFLGEISLKEIFIADTVERIEDWAFAQCNNLKRVVVGNEKVSLGRGVFKDCSQIKDICIGYDREDCKSAIFGTLPYKLEAEDLLLDKLAGSSEWYEKWDHRLEDYLGEADIEGYTTLVLCGEEDIMHDEPSYVSEKIKKKSELCLIRLMHNDALSDTMKGKFVDYVLKYSKGGKSEEAWLVMLERFADSMEYFNMYAEIGAINEDNIDALLLDMGDEHAEAKAFLMKLKNERYAKEDFFEDFIL